MRSISRRNAPFIILVFVFLMIYVYTSRVQLQYRKHSEEGLKYILIWTKHTANPTMFLGHGQEGFENRHCKHTNCYVTSDRNHLSRVTDYDVVFFHGPEVKYLPHGKLPQARSQRQKYVFASLEPSHYFPICSNRYDGYFNWTWTYRTDSTAMWGYIRVLDEHNNPIGPGRDISWLKRSDMRPVTAEFKNKLKTKSRAAAWLVSNCDDLSGRMDYALELGEALKKYDLSLDVYGTCGFLDCSYGECERLIDEKYYFYLSFENSFSEDYVTEKLLHALHNNAVPIVYGGANYTRFMADGMYLNAREMKAEQLAAKMHELINEPDEYAEYFKWRNHYKYMSRDDAYCEFCAALNNDTQISTVTVIDNFRRWWDNPDFCTYAQEWYQNSSLLLYTHGTFRNTFMI